MADSLLFVDDTRAVPEPGTPIVVAGLRKAFHTRGGTVDAVRGVDFTVHRGEIFGLLGPNGAGKTSTLRMLATLLPIDGGSARVAGIDVAKAPHEVRSRIGFVGQLGGSDLSATGRENLVLQAQLHGLSTGQARRRADELVAILELGEFVERKAITYSGGQRRRLDVALGIVHRPQILFLDEPTSGLDPQNRLNLWDQVRALRAAGTTIVVVTHYLEEADVLADRVAIFDHGTVVAQGTPNELKQAIAGDAIVVRPKGDPGELERLRGLLALQPYVSRACIEGEAVRVYVSDGAGALPSVVALLHTEAFGLASISLVEASLDDVFLRQTGRSLRDGAMIETREAA